MVPTSFVKDGPKLGVLAMNTRPLPKVGFLARNQFFVHILQFLCYHHDQTPKRQRFCVAHVAERAPGGLQEPIFGTKIARKSDFFYATPIKSLFFGLRQT